jgi:uncharacterized protein
MRLFFATDIHGSEACFRKFVNAGAVYGADVVVLGGDITGKALVPLVGGSRGWTMAFDGERLTTDSREEVDAWRRRVRDVGAYVTEVSEDENDRMRTDAVFRGRKFTEAMAASLRDWVRLATARLRPAGTRCIIGLGNDDEVELADALKSDWVIAPEGSVIELDGHEVVTWGWSNRTPWDSPREQDEDDLLEAIRVMTGQLRDPSRTLFNIHVPPWRSGLDIAPAIDESFRPKTEGGQMVMIPVGSTAVRAAIEEVQPLVGLHGHVHDSQGRAKIGRTMCLNPGSDYQRGVLRGALLQIHKQKVKNWAFTNG